MIVENCKSKVLVISPLLSLIWNQECTLIKKEDKSYISIMTTSVSFQCRTTWRGRLKGFNTLLLLKCKSDFDQMINKYFAKLTVNTKQKWKKT